MSALSNALPIYQNIFNVALQKLCIAVPGCGGPSNVPQLYEARQLQTTGIFIGNRSFL